jgi:osmotically-inducible protein OsmY
MIIKKEVNRFASDNWITTKAKAHLLVYESLKAVNVSV